MISKKSILTFFSVNGTLLTISSIKYFVLHYIQDYNIFLKFFLMFFTYIIRNYIMMFLLYLATNHKENTSIENLKNNSSYQISSHLYLFSTTLLEVITNLFIYNYLIDNELTDMQNIINSLLYFIPISFLFEIILDFFHYWTHRILHINKQFYKTIHKTHHKHANPVLINAYYFSPLDIIITINIPTILAISMLPYNLSLFQYTMMTVYKHYGEIAGHSGKKLSPSSSLPQCVWLPRLLNIELYAEDHDAHHKFNNCNYAKRFSLWDKLFGTYKKHNF